MPTTGPRRTPESKILFCMGRDEANKGDETSERMDLEYFVDGC